MQATHGNIIVKRVRESVSGSIILPDQRREETATGEIISVGPNCYIGVSVGDKIMFPDGEGKEIDGFIVIDQKHVMCVVE